MKYKSAGIFWLVMQFVYWCKWLFSQTLPLFFRQLTYRLWNSCTLQDMQHRLYHSLPLLSYSHASGNTYILSLWYPKAIGMESGWMKISVNIQYAIFRIMLYYNMFISTYHALFIPGSSTVPETTYTSICLFPSSWGLVQSSSKMPFCSQMKLRTTV